MGLITFLTTGKTGTSHFFDRIASDQVGYLDAERAFANKGILKWPEVDITKLLKMLRDSQTEHFNENRVSPLNDKGPPSLKIVPGDIFALSSLQSHAILLGALKAGKMICL